MLFVVADGLGPFPTRPIHQSLVFVIPKLAKLKDSIAAKVVIGISLNEQR